MSVILPFASSTSGNHFFDKLLPQATKLVFELLNDDKAAIATTIVCQSWKVNALLQEILQKIRNQQHHSTNLQHVHREMQLLNEYPPEMVRVFRNSGFPISQIPVLELDLANQWRGRIDYPNIQLGDMSHSVMRVQGLRGRPGVALKIQSSQEIISQSSLRGLRSMASETRGQLQQGNLSSLIPLLQAVGHVLVKRFFGEARRDDAVLLLFKRYKNPESLIWTYSWGNSDNTIEHLYNRRHDNNGHIGSLTQLCEHCPFNNGTVHATVLSGLLNGRDPDFSLPDRLKKEKNFRSLATDLTVEH